MMQKVFQAPAHKPAAAAQQASFSRQPSNQASPAQTARPSEPHTCPERSSKVFSAGDQPETRRVRNWRLVLFATEVTSTDGTSVSTTCAPSAAASRPTRPHPLPSSSTLLSCVELNDSVLIALLTSVMHWLYGCPHVGAWSTNAGCMQPCMRRWLHPVDRHSAGRSGRMLAFQ